ncbi:MAG: ROK family transcriptional regulator [Acidimicrobiia bacterium]|nr:ROK family transcriptional regulator [Acidimicrobiia bacterium]
MSGTTSGDLLELIRTGRADTRGDLQTVTGLSRSTVAQRIETLVAAGLVHELGGTTSTGGRPPVRLGFNIHGGVVLVADLGATHATLAVCDLSAHPLAIRRSHRDIADGPEPVLDWVRSEFDALLSEIGRAPSDVRGIGIGVPGPVDFAGGFAVKPPIMPGWNGFRIREAFPRYGVPVHVDNDVNIMALGEFWKRPDEDDLVVVKVGTGIGAGLIINREIHRGARGGAGDLGHVQAGGDVVCNCGNTGCLEASAGGAALARQLRDLGYDTNTVDDVVALLQRGNRDAIAAVREAGRMLGQVLASIVNLLNPSTILVGGSIALADDHLLAGLREIVFRRATSLSTAELRLATCALGDDAGVIGAAAMVAEQIFDPRTVDASLPRRAAAG